MLDRTISFIQEIYKTKDFISLHEPKFLGNEKKYLNECIDSTFVSSVGKYVDELESKIAKFTGAKYAVATSNGTSALHISLLLAGVNEDSEVITQPLTFVATCNAISYCNATPLFVDVDKDTMGMSPSALRSFLEKNTKVQNKKCINKRTNKIIKACVPMHTYGHPCKIDKIKEACEDYNIFLIEDAAESLGSFYKEKHTGTFGNLAAISFNGNKIITAGGGGCIITNDANLAKKAKHLSTTAKVYHKWNFNHDMIGYNYRMPNLNAALGCSQLEKLPELLKSKRELFSLYKSLFSDVSGVKLFEEPCYCKSNYWLQTIILSKQSLEERNKILKRTNDVGINTRPAWTLLHTLPPYRGNPRGNLSVSKKLFKSIINLPSSACLI